MIIIKEDNKRMNLSERLIENVTHLMRNNPSENGYGRLIDYNRQLFYECYKLDIFQFIPKDLVNNYCSNNNKSMEGLL